MWEGEGEGGYVEGEGWGVGLRFVLEYASSPALVLVTEVALLAGIFCVLDQSWVICHICLCGLA